MTTAENEADTRLRRQLAEAAIAHATRGEWREAADANRQIVELGADVDTYNRLGKALSELGEHAEALEAYQAALERDGTNRIAQRNVDRLGLMLEQSDGTAQGKGNKASASHFIEEMGKTGNARIINLASSRVLATLSPGDTVVLVVHGEELNAKVGRSVIGQVEPRIATRLLKLMASGNRYEAALATVHDGELRVIIREVFAHPDNFGLVSFPAAAGRASGDVRPYMKGSAVRYDDEDEAGEESEEEPEEVEELDTTLPELSGEPDLEEELLEEP